MPSPTWAQACGTPRGAKHRSSGSEFEASLSDFYDVIALDHIEPLVLGQVHMARWSALLVIDLLKDQQTAIGLFANNLQIDRQASEHLPSMSKRSPLMEPLFRLALFPRDSSNCSY